MPIDLTRCIAPILLALAALSAHAQAPGAYDTEAQKWAAGPRQLDGQRPLGAVAPVNGAGTENQFLGAPRSYQDTYQYNSDFNGATADAPMPNAARMRNVVGAGGAPAVFAQAGAVKVRPNKRPRIAKPIYGQPLNAGGKPGTAQIYKSPW
jgi:hypothetical protein